MTVCKGFDDAVTVLREGGELPVRLLSEGEQPPPLEDEKTLRLRLAPGVEAGAGSPLAAAAGWRRRDLALRSLRVRGGGNPHFVPREEGR